MPVAIPTFSLTLMEFKCFFKVVPIIHKSNVVLNRSCPLSTGNKLFSFSQTYPSLTTQVKITFLNTRPWRWALCATPETHHVTVFAIETPWIWAHVHTFKVFSEYMKFLKNGTCQFQIPVLCFIRNERKKMGLVKYKKRKKCVNSEAQEQYGQKSPTEMYVERKQPNMAVMSVVGRELFTFSERQSQMQSSPWKRRTVAVWSGKRMSCSWAMSRYGGALVRRRWQLLQVQMDAASVKPALSPYGSSLGCSLETPYGI